MHIYFTTYIYIRQKDDDGISWRVLPEDPFEMYLNHGPLVPISILVWSIRKSSIQSKKSPAHAEKTLIYFQKKSE